MHCCILILLVALYGQYVGAKDCEFFSTIKTTDFQTLRGGLMSNIEDCKKPETIKQWLDDVSGKIGNTKHIPFLYVTSVCNSYADMYLSMEDKGDRHYLLNELMTSPDNPYTPEEQQEFTFLLRGCSCDGVRENLLSFLCPILASKFDHFDPGFHAACFKAMFSNKYRYISNILKNKVEVQNEFYKQMFHEAMHHLTNYKIFDANEVKNICRTHLKGHIKEIRKNHCGKSIYKALIKEKVSAAHAYTYDRLQFYLVYGNELLNSRTDVDVNEEISKFTESNALLTAYDMNISSIKNATDSVKHSTEAEIRETFFKFATNAYQFATEDSYTLLVGLYEFWNKSTSEAPSKDKHEVTFTILIDTLKQFINSKPGRPDLMLSELIPGNRIEAKVTNEFLQFTNFLEHLFSIEGGKKDSNSYLNCFLVKEDVIDLTLDWLCDKYDSEKYPFDRPFAIEIFKILIKVPSVTFRVLTNKRKYLPYFSPHLLDKSIFNFHDDEDAPIWNQDLYLFCQIFSDTHLQFTKNDILNPFFEEFELSAIKMRKIKEPKEFITGNFATNSQFQPVYEYSKLSDSSFDKLIVFLSFMNSIESDTIFGIVFDAIFVRKEPYELSAERLETKITKDLPAELTQFDFKTDEAENLFSSNPAKILDIITDKVSLRNKILIYLQQQCTKRRNIIGGIDMDRLEIILIRIPNSDLAEENQNEKLLKECSLFDTRLWKLYKERSLPNMKFLGVQGLLRRWSMAHIKQENEKNINRNDTNKTYFKLRKEFYDI